MSRLKEGVGIVRRGFVESHHVWHTARNSHNRAFQVAGGGATDLVQTEDFVDTQFMPHRLGFRVEYDDDCVRQY